LDSPVAFTVKVQYSQNGHQLKTASFNLGAIVIGDIQLKVNSLDINYMGNVPVLVGSVVNEGNTPAQFVNVEMLQQGQSHSQASFQYLGNIATNSTKPINIPLQDVRILSGQRQNDISSDKNEAPFLTRIALNSSAMKSFGTRVQNNTNPGTYPVSLKLTYYDDLKNSHDLILDSNIQINPIQPEGTFNHGDGLFVILIAAIIIAIGIAIILLRKWFERNEVSFARRHELVSRITTKIKGGKERALPPNEKREGAPFSPI
jgi:hypothetical protein